MQGQCTEEPITFVTEDGFPLSGILVRPAVAAGAVLISSGTGFHKAFYLPLARHLASRGLASLVYDYRGIGGSSVHDLAASGIAFQDWGRQDMPAAADALMRETGAGKLLHIAHSVAGHFVGLMRNHDVFSRHAFISVGSGYWRHHKFRYVPVSMYFWWIYGASQLARRGYIAPGGGWRGTALPPDVFRQWRSWCHQRHYFRSDLKTRLAPHWYGEVTSPIRAWIFSDDPIATRPASRDMLANYPRADIAVSYRKPSEFGVGRIGHEGAFRKHQVALWNEIADWLTG